MFSVTVNTGSTPTAPQRIATTMPPRTVRRIEWRVPPGPRGEVGFQFSEGGNPFLPRNSGGYIVTDDEANGWDVQGQMDSGKWEIRAYNTGNYAHRLEVRYLCDLVQSQDSGPPPLTPDQAAQAGGVSGDAAPPPTDLPPPPVVAPPVLPPPPDLGGGGTLPLPQLPPPPELPGPPSLPGLATAGQTSPQPSYNWWNDAMGRLLTWPDQSTTTRFDEVWVDPQGHVRWAAWSGGAGNWESYTQAISDQGGTYVSVDACFTAYAGVVRLNIVAVDPAGRRWLKVMDAGRYALIQEWTQAPAQQPLELVTG